MTGIPTDSKRIEEEEQDEQAEETTEKSEATDPAESSTEKVKEEAASSDAEENSDVNIPLNKDKRFQQVLKERDEHKRQLAELMEWRKSLESSAEREVQTEAIPHWFTELYGDNPEVWKVMQLQFQEIEKRAADNAYKRVESSRQEEEKKLSEAKKFVDTQFETMKEEGLAFDRNAVIKTALDMKLYDEAGNYNLRAAYEVWNARQSKPQSTNKKRIASDTVKGTSGERKQSPSLTELRKMGGFRGFNKFLENNV